MNGRTRMVALYAAASLVLVVALGVLTRAVLQQDRERCVATADAHFHDDLRTAMWRMETRVGTMLATSTRTAAASAWIDPASNSSYALDYAGPKDAQPTESVVEAADRAFVLACELAAVPQPVVEPQQVEQTGIDPVSRGSERSQQEFANRYGANQLLQLNMANDQPDGGLTTCVGPLAPAWAECGDGLDLWLARRIEAPEGVRHESYRIEWAALRDTLLGEIEDLFPAASLQPIVDVEEVIPVRPADLAVDDDDAARMAAIPARLVIERAAIEAQPDLALVLTLGGAWGALALALLFGAVALRASFAYGDKHRRFTHAVTHELRTPLTTFRMYSEMLARGIVTGDAQAEYLATLESESSRLAGLVENVLRYARLEEGGAKPELTTISASSLVERCVPELARICGQSGGALEVREDADVVVDTDPSAIQQILSNLVENACKYGRAGEEREASVRLETSTADGALRIDVVDDGPGIPIASRRTVFDPFERAGRDSSDPAPGVGLGLALSRDLAREVGGELVLVPTERGARFRVTLRSSS